MIDKNRVGALFSTIAIFLNSDIAMAVEKTTSSSKMSYLPLIILFALLIIFRKKLFNEATPQIDEPDHHDAPEQKAPPSPEKVAVEAKVEAKPKVETKAKPKAETKAKPKAKPKAKAKTGLVNIRDESNQCQASTAKGTRCKRTTTLEEATATIDGTTYELTVCSQHNNDSIKPFSELIK